MDASVAVQLLKGLESFVTRFAAQCRTAQAVAVFLESHHRVTRVMYPGLVSHPDHSLAKQQMEEFGTIIAFDLDGSEQEMYELLDSLSEFSLSFGAGFSRSLAAPAKLFYERGFDTDLSQGESTINSNTIRLSIGLESEVALIADLESSLQ